MALEGAGGVRGRDCLCNAALEQGPCWAGHTQAGLAPPGRADQLHWQATSALQDVAPALPPATGPEGQLGVGSLWETGPLCKGPKAHRVETRHLRKTTRLSKMVGGGRGRNGGVRGRGGAGRGVEREIITSGIRRDLGAE